MSARRSLMALLAAAVLAAGCGDDGEEGATADPASIAPANAALYFDAVLRPTGDQREQVDAFLSKVLDTQDPGARIEQLVDEEFAAEGEDATFAEDVDPWVGDRAAVFVTGYEDDPPALVAVSSDDPQAGIELLRSESTDVTERQYEGVTYQVDEQGEVFGVIEDFVVFGDEPALKASIDALKADALVENDAYTDAIDRVSDDAIARAYLNTAGIVDRVSREQEAPEEAVREFFGSLGREPAVASVTAAADQLAVEVDSPAGEDGTEAERSSLLEQVPADAWLTLGFNDLGGKIERLIARLESAEIPGLSEGGLSQQLQARTGINLEHDLLSWLDDGAVFLTGTSSANIGGALVLQSRDAAASRGLLQKLQRTLKTEGDLQLTPLRLGGGGQGFDVTDQEGEPPLPFHFVQRGDRVVVGYRDQVTESAFQAGEPLSADPDFTAAREALGDEPPLNFFLSIPTALKLAEAQGVAEDPQYVRLKPYLQSLAFLAAGSAQKGDRTISRLILGVK
jgi:hypothetical protein